MSEQVTYTPRVSVGSASGLAILAAAASNATVAGASFLFKKMMETETWMSTCQRETALQESMKKNLIDLSHAAGSNGQGYSENRSALQVLAMTKALGEVKNLSAMVYSEHGRELADISAKGDQLLLNIRNSLIDSREVERQAQSLNQRLRTITADAHQKLASSEESVLKDIVGKTLESGGYTVTRKNDAIRAVKGSTAIWMTVDQKAGMALDVSGFSGLSCQKAIADLENRLINQGICLERNSSEFHGKEEGGSLVQRVSKIFALPRDSKPLINPLKKVFSGKEKKSQHIHQIIRER